MERRAHPRVPVRIPAKLTVLSDPWQEFDVQVEEISGKGARVLLQERLPVNAVVKLVVDDDLFLGEVCHCQADAKGFSVGVSLDCALVSLSSIRALMHALMPATGSSAGSGGSQAADAGHHRNHQERHQRHEQNPA